ncbi:hypothetical protein [Streptomyces olivaceus]|uniref:hypothetical protein n=1 Tax=Streptomyces olivaceus TaxID=47716 RepID=UPI0037A30C98
MAARLRTVQVQGVVERARHGVRLRLRGTGRLPGEPGQVHRRDRTEGRPPEDRRPGRQHPCHEPQAARAAQQREKKADAVRPCGGPQVVPHRAGLAPQPGGRGQGAEPHHDREPLRGVARPVEQVGRQMGPRARRHQHRPARVRQPAAADRAQVGRRGQVRGGEHVQQEGLEDQRPPEPARQLGAPAHHHRQREFNLSNKGVGRGGG